MIELTHISISVRYVPGTRKPVIYKLLRSEHDLRKYFCATACADHIMYIVHTFSTFNNLRISSVS